MVCNTQVRDQSNLNHFYEQYGGERRALPKSRNNHNTTQFCSLFMTPTQKTILLVESDAFIPKLNENYSLLFENSH